MTEMTETLRLVASLVVLFTAVLQFLPRAARWIATKVRPYYYPGSVLMNLSPKLRHPFNRKKRAELAFYLGWHWRDPDEDSLTA